MRTLCVVSVSLLLAACNLNTDYFGEYRGKNIMGNYDFDAEYAPTDPKWTTTTLGLNTVGVDDYMLWEAVGAAGNADLAVDTAASTPTTQNGHPVYRLEILNLVPNGDFENLPDQSIGSFASMGLSATEWSAPVGTPQFALSTIHGDNGSPTIPHTINYTGSHTIDHRSLLFSAQTGGRYLDFDVKAALAARWLEGQYRLRLDLINVSTGTTLNFTFDDGAGGVLQNTDADNGGVWDKGGLEIFADPPPSSPLVVTGLSQSFTVGAGLDQRRLRIGDDISANAEILDNVRVLLANQLLSVKSEFSSLKSGTLQLLPGTKTGAYIFTIRVHDDPTANQSAGAGHQPNRFHPDGITVTIRGRAKDAADAILLQKFIPRLSGWPTWTTLTFKGGLDFVNSDVDIDNAGGEKALVVSISPTDDYDLTTDGRDVGSILLSQPELKFNP